MCVKGMSPPQTYIPSFHGDFDSHPWLPKMTYRTLGNTDLDVSTLGYGGAALGNFYGDVDKLNAIDTIQETLKSGVNYIDTAPWYGHSESVIGEALKTVPRKAFYLATKVGRYSTPTWENRFDFSASRVLRSVEESLRLLGVDFLDIIQVHDVEFSLDPQKVIKETLPALETVVKAGKARYIGITGYDLNFLKTVAEGFPCDTVLVYARYNLHDSGLQSYLPYFREKGMGVINATPLAMGLLSNAGPPQWHPASEKLKEKSKIIAAHLRNKERSLQDEALKFSLNPKEKEIGTTLVSIPTKEILNDNLKVVTSSLTPEEETLHEEIKSLFSEDDGEKCHWEGVEISDFKKTLNLI